MSSPTALFGFEQFISTLRLDSRIPKGNACYNNIAFRNF
jgi:hypothetical protein